MADSPREALLVANRIAELVETPLRGHFDLDHLRAIHAHIFQDLPQHRPGEVRSDTSGWSKTRMLEGQPGVHDVPYAHENVAGRVEKILKDLNGPTGLAGLGRDAFASRMAGLYGDLDHAHSFHEGNSRTLREFTRSLALAAGYELDWAPTGAGSAERNRLYVARDIAVLERAYPGLTPQRGMETNDRYEYEASLALPGLRRHNASLEGIIREGLTPVASPQANPVAPAQVEPQKGIAALALEALARYRQGPEAEPAQPTPIAGRVTDRPQAPAAPLSEPDRPSAAPERPYSQSPSPGP